MKRLGIRRTQGWVGIGIAALIAGILTLRTLTLRRFDRAHRYQDVYYVPDSRLLPIISLGFKEAFADFLWLKALIYFGDEIYHRGNMRHLRDYADAIFSLDPDFRAAYVWMGTGLVYRTGTVTKDDVKLAIDYLRRGVKRFPDDGDLAWNLGATLRFELPPLLSSQKEKEAAKAESVEYLQTAARLGAGPAWLVLSNATELYKLGKTEQALRHLEEMYTTVSDSDTKEQIMYQIEALRSKAAAEGIARFNEEFERKHNRDYPYVSDPLYMLLGERL